MFFNVLTHIIAACINLEVYYRASLFPKIQSGANKRNLIKMQNVFMGAKYEMCSRWYSVRHNNTVLNEETIMYLIKKRMLKKTKTRKA